MSTRNKKEQKWQQVQERAFTSWIQQTLQKKDKSLVFTDLRTQLEDGVMLIKFFEQLSKRTMKEKSYPQPKTRIQKIQNCHLGLQFLERETGVSAYHSGCSAEDIVDCAKDLKLVLGLLWTLYRKFRMVVNTESGRGGSGDYIDERSTDPNSPNYDPTIDPSSPYYDPVLDPNSPYYDPTQDIYHPSYDPALDPNNVFDPNSPLYIPALDPKNPAYDPTLDPRNPQFNPKHPLLDPNNPGYLANHPYILAAAGEGGKKVVRLRKAKPRDRKGKRAGYKGASSSSKTGTKGPEDQMLEWVKGLTVNYPGVVITNYKNSFSNGLAFAALAKEYDLSSFKYTWEEIQQMPPEKVLELAMDHAEKHMGVTRLLDVDEIVDGQVDDRALALYSSLYYTAFQNKSQMETMKDKMSTEVALEKKSTEELIKLLHDTTAELAQVKVSLEEEKERSEQLHRELLELRTKNAELTETCATREKELTAVRLDFTNMERDRNELLTNYHQMQERNAQLNEQVEAIQVLCDGETAKAKKASHKLKELQAQLEQTQAQLQAAQTETTTTTEKLKETSAELQTVKEQAVNTAQQLQIEREGGERKLEQESTKLQKIEDESRKLNIRLEQESEDNKKLTSEKKKLQEEKVTLEGQVEEQTTQIEELKTNAAAAAKEKKKMQSQITKYEEQLGLNTSGLSLLRRNLDQHLDDLNRWHKYLEGSAADVEEVSDTIGQLAEELEKLPPKEQLNLLSGKLIAENELMTKILQEKIAKQQSKAKLEAEKTKEKEKEKEKKSGKS